MCSYSEHKKQTREISEFFQLTLDQPAGGATKSRSDGNYCLRSFHKFPKILFIYLSNLFTSASNSNQMLSTMTLLACRYKLNSVMVPLGTALLAILAIVLQIDLIVGEVVVIVTRIVLPCHWKISVPH